MNETAYTLLKSDANFLANKLANKLKHMIKQKETPKNTTQIKSITVSIELHDGPTMNSIWMPHDDNKIATAVKLMPNNPITWFTNLINIYTKND